MPSRFTKEEGMPSLIKLIRKDEPLFRQLNHNLSKTKNYRKPPKVWFFSFYHNYYLCKDILNTHKCQRQAVQRLRFKEQLKKNKSVFLNYIRKPNMVIYVALVSQTKAPNKAVRPLILLQISSTAVINDVSFSALL